MSRTKRKPSTPQPPPSSKPQLPLAVHESVAEIEKRTKKLLEGCRPFSLSFSVPKGTEVLRTCAVDAFDKQADYYTSMRTFVPEWLDEIADQTITATLDLVDMFDLDWQTRPTVEQELRRTLQAHLEQRAQRVTLIARLPKPALIRMEAATAAFMAEYLPKLEREANKSGPIHDAELLRDFVTHQFNLVARECMTVCGSAQEFEAELRSDIARFVHCGLSQYRWLADPMRQELDRGFALFVMRANPWAEIPEKDRASVWHVGAITGEALTHAALKLQAEAWKHAAEGGFPEAKRGGAAESSGDEPVRTNAGPADNETNGGGVDRRAVVGAFISKLSDAGRKITRKQIWTVAGYTNATEFERFQRGDNRTTQSAAAAFNRVLNMKPEDFIGLLDKKSASK